MDAKVRLHLDQPLVPGQPLSLAPEQAHYLLNVMRLGPGARIAVFNGRDGEWLAAVEPDGRRGARATPLHPTRPPATPPDLWLLFAPIKKARTDFIVEKAAEMGVRRILPVQTDFTNAERIRRDRLQAHVVEAVEQCGGIFVPEVAELAPLARLLDGWDGARRIMLCDEGAAGQGRGLPEPPPGAAPGPWAVLIGPEGGFSPTERARLHALPFVHVASLGPRILRADTAAVAALALWQARLGDWGSVALP